MCSNSHLARLPAKRHIIFYYKTLHPTEAPSPHCYYTFKCFHQRVSNPVCAPVAQRVRSGRIRAGWVGRKGSVCALIYSTVLIYSTPAHLNVSFLVSSRWHRPLVGLQRGNRAADHKGNFCFSKLYQLQFIP